MKIFHHHKLLQWGLCKEEMLFISDVENGAKCNCKCSKSGENLIARNNGKKNLHHFAHVSNSECLGAVESAIHRAIKQIFVSTKTILLPACYGNGPYEFKKYLDAKLVIFDQVEIEKRIRVGEETIIPDAIGYIQGKRIFIEFALTHFIDQTKLEILQRNQIACIEVDLRHIEQSPYSIKRILTKEINCKHWIYNPKIYELVQNDHKEAERKEVERKIKEDTELSLLQEKQKEWIQKAVQIKHQRVKQLLNHGNLYESCPVKDEIWKGFFNSEYGNIPIIKELASNNDWNGVIYGTMGKIINIFIGSKQYILVPANYMELPKEAQEKYHEILDAVVKYRDLLNVLKRNPCAFCDMFIKFIDYKIYCKYNQGNNVERFYKYDKVIFP